MVYHADSESITGLALFHDFYQQNKIKYKYKYQCVHETSSSKVMSLKVTSCHKANFVTIGNIIVTMIASSATSDDKVGIMKTLGFQWSK